MNISTKTAGKMVKQLAGNGTGQSLMDRVTQAKYSLAGSGLGKAVAKATTVEAIAPKRKHLDSYEMSLFVRKYSKYVEEKTISYRAMAFDFCKVKRGKSDGVLRVMPIEKLLKALPVLEKQINTLLEFEAVTKDLSNPIITAAFVLLYKDLIRLFASYNEGMINLIEKYFTLKRRECKLAMKLYHNFPDLMEKVTEFLTVAESMGIGDRDSLGLVPVPDKVIKAMEKHLALLEKKKKKGEEEEEGGEEEVVKKSKKKPPKPKMTVKMPSSPAKSKRPETPPVNDEEDIFTRKPEPPVPAKSSECNDTEPSSSKIKNSPIKPVLKIESEDQKSSSDDGEGLPDALQQEIIAAATNHFITAPTPKVYRKNCSDLEEDHSINHSNKGKKKKSRHISSSNTESEESSEEIASKSKKKDHKKKNKKDSHDSDDDIKTKSKKKDKKYNKDLNSESEDDRKKHKKHRKKHEESDEESEVVRKKINKKKKHQSSSETEEEQKEYNEKKMKKRDSDSESSCEEDNKTKKNSSKNRSNDSSDERAKKKSKKKSKKSSDESEDERKEKKSKKKNKKSDFGEEVAKKSHLNDLIDLDFLSGEPTQSSALEPTNNGNQIESDFVKSESNLEKDQQSVYKPTLKIDPETGLPVLSLCSEILGENDF